MSSPSLFWTNSSKPLEGSIPLLAVNLTLWIKLVKYNLHVVFAVKLGVNSQFVSFHSPLTSLVQVYLSNLIVGVCSIQVGFIVVSQVVSFTFAFFIVSSL